MKWFRRDRDEDRAPAPPERGDDVPALREALRATIRTVNASSGRLPTGAVVDIRDIGDRLGELLDHESRVGAVSGAGVGSYEMVTLSSVIRDYLPTSIDTYLALPPAVVESHRNARGESPADELAGQLRLLGKGIDELAAAVYSGDAQRLSVQGRFLESKFASSDLDL